MAQYTPRASRESSYRSLRASGDNWYRDADLLEEWLYIFPELLERVLTHPSGLLEFFKSETVN